MPKVERALTWCQPVASAHAAGRKPIENRKWRPTLPGRGAPLLLGLHAGARWWRPDGAPAVSLWAVATEPLRALRAGQVLPPMADRTGAWVRAQDHARRDGQWLEARLSALADEEPTHTFDWSNLRADQGALFGGAPC